MDFNAKYLVVGAGFSGSVIAERIANDLKEKVIIIENREHIGGNCYSKIDDKSGIEHHVYGSHIFHTSNHNIWNYINNFTKFNEYKHRVLTQSKGKVFSLPINLATINQFYEKNFTPNEAKQWIRNEVVRDSIENPTNLEDKAVSLVGRPLYEAFFLGYTKKQWETEPNKLPANIITRLPVRFNYNDRYFSDTYEGIPLEGYTSIFKKMLKNENIQVQLGVDFFKIKQLIPSDTKVIFTGPIDKYFNYKFGKLSWRTLDLESEVIESEDFQGTSVMNFADETVPYTRIHEFKHFHPERKIDSGKTFISREYSRFARESDLPYYPVGTDQDKLILSLYQKEALQTKNVHFLGRLGNYKYMDMHQAIGAALLMYERDIKTKATGMAWTPVFSNKNSNE